jgi:hypothetical protein
MININSIWDNHKPTGEIHIKTRIDNVTHVNCFLGTNSLTNQHFFLLSVSENIEIPELKNYRFKSLQIYCLVDESSKEKHLYIHLLDNDLKGIFSLFIENILNEITETLTEDEALIRTLNVVTHWKRLLDKIAHKGLDIEKQKGLIGELLFLNFLLNQKKTSSNAIHYWTSTEEDFQSKDFTIGDIGVEVKFTSSQHPQINISNERQLDNENFKELFLVLYCTEAVKANGFSLNSLIKETSEKIKTDEMLSLFNNKLKLYGYHEDDSEYYGGMYSFKNTFCFVISSEFPKIIKGNLPLGIFETTYKIEISSIGKFRVELESIFSNK